MATVASGRLWLRWLGRGCGLALVLVVAVAAFGWLRPLAGERLTPSGLRRNTARYVTVRDGTRLAVDVWLPADASSGQRLPTLFRASRYFRDIDPGPLERVLRGLGVSRYPDPDNEAMNAAGLAVVGVEVRGSGASFGQRAIELSTLEIDDLVEVLDWVVKQPWSDGQVGLFGMSYDGMVAELLAARAHLAVRAAAPLFSQWDEYANQLRPGGLLNLALLEPWSRGTRVDTGDLAGAFGLTGWQRWLLPLQMRGPKPVDEDRDRHLLGQAVASHSTADPLRLARAFICRDDLTTNGLALKPLSPASHADALARCGVPLLVQAGWLDAGTAAAALQRFQSLPNPQTVVIGAWSHGGFGDADPFALPDKHVTPRHRYQTQHLIKFMKLHFSGDAKSTSAPVREVRYVNLADGTWKTATHWPPDGLVPRRWYFHEDGRLETMPPAAENANDKHAVDFGVTAGRALTRWHQGPDCIYPNRAELDRRLLTYTSPPLEEAAEVTGSPVLHLHLATTATDGAFHAYLEDVAPDGHVTYVTEGMLRALHRKLTGAVPAQHSFLRADALPLVAGETTSVEFELLPTSVVFGKGHRVRIALAGADAGNFERVPAAGSVEWQVHRDRFHPSYFELPLRTPPTPGLPTPYEIPATPP